MAFCFFQKEYSKELYGMINTKFRTVVVTSGRREGKYDQGKGGFNCIYMALFLKLSVLSFFHTFFIVLLLLYFYTFLYVLHLPYYISSHTYYFYDKINSTS